MRGKALLVTGSNQGIGLAIALAAARAGAASIVLTGRDADRGAAAAAEVGSTGCKAHFIAAELADPGATDVIFDAAIARFGQLDILVNSAALTDRGGVADATQAFWDRMNAVNLRAPFFLMQRTINHLRGRKTGGAIVNILSMNAHGGSPELGVYSATKAALALLTKNAAQAHRFDRIRINGINVGWTDTPAERAMQSQTLGRGVSWLAEEGAKQPFGRLLVAGDVARLALFLMSDASIPMTGALIDQEQWVVGAHD